MKSKSVLIGCIFVVSFFMFLACAHIGTSADEEMYILGSALTKLSSAVESTVRYKAPPTELSDLDLAVLSTKHDPKLLDSFANHRIRILKENRHAIVLICSKSDQGLLEDAGCTAKLDKHLWKNSNPCEFTLTVRSVCKP